MRGSLFDRVIAYAIDGAIIALWQVLLLISFGNTELNKLPDAVAAFTIWCFPFLLVGFAAFQTSHAWHGRDWKGIGISAPGRQRIAELTFRRQSVRRDYSHSAPASLVDTACH